MSVQRELTPRTIYYHSKDLKYYSCKSESNGKCIFDDTIHEYINKSINDGETFLYKYLRYHGKVRHLRCMSPCDPERVF